MNKIELLAPAGNLDRLKTALAYGADAVYAGGDAFSLRVRAKNFSRDDLARGIEYTHNKNKKFYLTANVILHNDDLDDFAEFLEDANKLAPDALIISDPGAFLLAKEIAPKIPIHISTQANNVNYKTVNFWQKQGASRVVLARELSLSEVKTIRENTCPELELEAFVHGAMCISYSGRCLLSSYMTGRESNSGDCAHPCRWNYTLEEEMRPGEHFPVFENERGTFIFNSKDMCMIEHVHKLIDAGVTSFKIEGRVKTEYYVATVVGAYRRAIDAYLENPEKYQFNPKWKNELMKVSNRGYTTGFWFGNPKENGQEYENGGYIRNYDVVAIADGTDKDGNTVWIQKNKLSVGDDVEIMSPGKEPFCYTVTSMTDMDGNTLLSVPHPMQKFVMNIGQTLPEYSMIRKKN